MMPLFSCLLAERSIKSVFVRLRNYSSVIYSGHAMLKAWNLDVRLIDRSINLLITATTSQLKVKLNSWSRSFSSKPIVFGNADLPVVLSCFWFSKKYISWAPCTAYIHVVYFQSLWESSKGPITSARRNAMNWIPSFVSAYYAIISSHKIFLYPYESKGFRKLWILSSSACVSY